MKWQVIPLVGSDKGTVVAEFTTLAYALRFGEDHFGPSGAKFVTTFDDKKDIDMPAQVQEFMDYSGQFTRMDRSPKVIWDGPITSRRKWLREEHNELQDAIDDQYPIGIIDGGIDLVYVIFGMFAEFGLDPRIFFDEVHRSNMTKTPNDGKYTGKIRKGDDYECPDLGSVFLERYGKEAYERFLR